jgi:hypothetical protein
VEATECQEESGAVLRMYQTVKLDTL